MGVLAICCKSSKQELSIYYGVGGTNFNQKRKMLAKPMSGYGKLRLEIQRGEIYQRRMMKRNKAYLKKIVSLEIEECESLSTTGSQFS